MSEWVSQFLSPSPDGLGVVVAVFLIEVPE